MNFRTDAHFTFRSGPVILAWISVYDQVQALDYSAAN
jgi:hypothetical protein